VNDILKDVAGDPVFCACALVAIAGALTVVLRRNPVYSALGLMTAFLSFAVLFIKLHATFLAAMHVLVYTGAILVLFLFVIMLLNLSEKELGREPGLLTKALSGAIAAGICGMLLFALLHEGTLRDPVKDIKPQTMKFETSAHRGDLVVEDAGNDRTNTATWGGVEHVGTAIFTSWAFPFELVSLLIVVAILGAVVLAKKKLPPEA
jgi:NADH-quinone oxidoreductase subunit J